MTSPLFHRLEGQQVFVILSDMVTVVLRTWKGGAWYDKMGLRCSTSDMTALLPQLPGCFRRELPTIGGETRQSGYPILTD